MTRSEVGKWSILLGVRLLFQRGTVHNGGEGAAAGAWGWPGMVARGSCMVSLLTHTLPLEGEQEVGPQDPAEWLTFSSKVLSPKDPTTFPKSALAGKQVCKCMALWGTFRIQTSAPWEYGKQEDGHLNYSNSVFCVNVAQGTTRLVWPYWVRGIRQARVHSSSNRLFLPVSLLRQGLFCVCGTVISLITDKFLLHI